MTKKDLLKRIDVLNTRMGKVEDAVFSTYSLFDSVTPIKKSKFEKLFDELYDYLGIERKHIEEGHKLIKKSGKK